MFCAVRAARCSGVVLALCLRVCACALGVARARCGALAGGRLVFGFGVAHGTPGAAWRWRLSWLGGVLVSSRGAASSRARP